jgi:hypothetical protein
MRCEHPQNLRKLLGYTPIGGDGKRFEQCLSCMEVIVT